MKIFVAVGLLCIVGLALSYPADAEDEQGGKFLRPSFRRRSGGNPPYRSRQSEAILPDYQPKRQNQERQYDKPKRRNTVPAPVAPSYAAQAENRDIVGASSNAYSGYDAGSYDESHLKFEQGVQNQANSYNSDSGVKDGRLQFAIAGQQGPNSYRFGYDTGKGSDRTFRIEERDVNGIVRGRYGYYDPSGKFRIVNYSAHPEYGFQAEGNFGPK